MLSDVKNIALKPGDGFNEADRSSPSWPLWFVKKGRQAVQRSVNPKDDRDGWCFASTHLARPRRHGEMDNTSICSVLPTRTCCQHLETTTSEGSNPNISQGTGYELNFVETYFQKQLHSCFSSLIWVSMFRLWASYLYMQFRGVTCFACLRSTWSSRFAKHEVLTQKAKPTAEDDVR